MMTTEKEFPPRPSPTVEQDGPGGLPGQAEWDLAPLRKYFAIIGTSFDEDKRLVIWVAEARRGFEGYINSVFNPNVRFYDAADARVYSNKLGFEPEGTVLKGETHPHLPEAARRGHPREDQAGAL